MVVAVILFIVCVIILSAIATARRLSEAKKAYEIALAKLASNPGDNSLRIAALDAGRHYADLARKAAGSKGRAIFDEVALSNDLNARAGTGLPRDATGSNKTCPQCAEQVKWEAQICRFCRHRFDAAA